eukprot:TRINITY_DN2166_c0_g1_i1.p1 TRINITY_DN2166_c0_g1~~TRINITY_DN2166_c0_g1_i1.p1  ORF type:complete len:456 (+),score=102.16 TRINITY_DN2166_c0_g1_i1:30-1397(+)
MSIRNTTRVAVPILPLRVKPEHIRKSPRVGGGFRTQRPLKPTVSSFEVERDVEAASSTERGGWVESRRSSQKGFSRRTFVSQKSHPNIKDLPTILISPAHSDCTTSFIRMIRDKKLSKGTEHTTSTPSFVPVSGDRISHPMLSNASSSRKRSIRGHIDMKDHVAILSHELEEQEKRHKKELRMKEMEYRHRLGNYRARMDTILDETKRRKKGSRDDPFVSSYDSESSWKSRDEERTGWSLRRQRRRGQQKHLLQGHEHRYAKFDTLDCDDDEMKTKRCQEEVSKQMQSIQKLRRQGAKSDSKGTISPVHTLLHISECDEELSPDRSCCRASTGAMPQPASSLDVDGVVSPCGRDTTTNAEAHPQSTGFTSEVTSVSSHSHLKRRKAAFVCKESTGIQCEIDGGAEGLQHHLSLDRALMRIKILEASLWKFQDESSLMKKALASRGWRPEEEDEEN